MERYVEVPGGRLFAVDEGAGRPLALIHAAIVDLESWQPMVPGLIDRGFRVIRYDMRGFGRTETEDVEYNPRADLVAVLDAVAVRRAAVVGNSRGGQTAIEAAIEFPDRLAAVVTLGAAPGGFDGGATPLEKELYRRGDALEAASPLDRAAYTELLVSIWLDGPGQPVSRVSPELRREVWRKAYRQSEPGRISGRQRSLQPAGNDRLGEVRCPVLALAGAFDISHEVKAARQTAAAVPNGRAVIWPDVGHLIAMEQPDRLVDLIADFLTPLEDWT
jgi:3-oxoadipate enol-lactonase